VRTARGVFHSFGAGLSLLAAATCALLAVSAAIGFRGFPGLSHELGPAALLVAAPEAEHPASPPDLVIAPPARQARSGPGARRTSRPSAAEPRGAVKDAPVLSDPAPAAAAPGTPAAAPVASAPASAQRPAASTPAGETVRATGDTVGTAVAPVSPTAAQTVQDATDAVGGLVDQTLRP